KSLGNFEPLSALLDRHDPQAIRLLFLQTGYRKPMNFTEESIAGATTGLRRLQSAYDTLRSAPSAPHDESAASVADSFAARFRRALDDDLNTSGAMAVLFDIAADAAKLSERGAASSVAALLHQAMSVLGISPSERAKTFEFASSVKTHTVASVDYKIERRGAALVSEAAIERLRMLVGEIVPPDATSPPDAVDAVVEARIKAKSDKDFALADRLREALADAGVLLADSKEGTTWSAGG
ncbi:MAG: hypothetical protein IAI50_06730, partial [Candidatus Eremiobacteraeota bacterium]|nr:hypothetical protein [Candidatus Eremiobacteraeota bacterium]